MVGDAVKVTSVPAQMMLSASEDPIATEGVRFGFTVTVVSEEVPVAALKQVSELVTTTFTLSPLASVVVEKVEEVEEVEASLTNH